MKHIQQRGTTKKNKITEKKEPRVLKKIRTFCTFVVKKKERNIEKE